MNTYEKAIKLFKTRPELLDAVFHEITCYSRSSLTQQTNKLLDGFLPEVVFPEYTYSPPTVEINGRYYDEAELIDFIEQHTNVATI